MTNSEKIVSREEQETNRDRRRAVAKQRRRYNIRRHPLISVLLVLLLLIFGFAMTCVSVPLPWGNSSPILISLWNHSVKIAVWLIAFLLVMAVLTSAPPLAKAWGIALVHIGFVDKYGYSPALVSSQMIGNKGAEQHIFYSKGIALDKWIERQHEIEDALNITIKDPSHYDHNGHYIVFTAKHGVDNAQGEQGELLYDDEL